MAKTSALQLGHYTHLPSACLPTRKAGLSLYRAGQIATRNANCRKVISYGKTLFAVASYKAFRKPFSFQIQRHSTKIALAKFFPIVYTI